MARTVMVGMAEIHVVCEPGDVLSALGLGSCVGVCMYDTRNRIAGMAHVVLPASGGATDQPPGKFADTAVPALLEEMMRAGASRTFIQVALAGGAQVFSFSGNAPRLDIGARNCEAVMEALDRLRVRLVAQDLRGTIGRSVQLHATDGRVFVKTIGQGQGDLVTLAEVVRQSAARAA